MSSEKSAKENLEKTGHTKFGRDKSEHKERDGHRDRRNQLRFLKVERRRKTTRPSGEKRSQSQKTTNEGRGVKRGDGLRVGEKKKPDR